MQTRGYNLVVKDIFTEQTVKAISRKVKKLVSLSSQEAVTGVSALTPIQNWLFDGPIVNKNHFIQSVLLEISSSIPVDSIRRVFDFIQTHHDALRSVFVTRGGKLLQEFSEGGKSLSLEEFDFTREKAPEAELLQQTNKIQSGIDLMSGPLVKLGLFRFPGKNKLLIVVHHLVIDGVSWRILFEDMHTLFNQQARGELLSLPPKTDSFKIWSQSLIAYSQSRRAEESRAFWTFILSRNGSRIPKLNVDKGPQSVSRETCTFTKRQTKDLLT